MITGKVSVIIPTMNEEESIGEVMDAVNNALKGMDYEVLVVDTNSKDRTREIASEKGAHVIDEPRRGYGRAYKTGFEKANGDYIVTLDADCTYPAEAIPDLLAALEKENLDFISCERMTRMEKGAMTIGHRFGNWVLKTTMNILFRMRFKDSQTGMWVFRRKILPTLHLTSDGMALSEEIKIEAHARGFRIEERPIVYRPRKGEVKLNSWGDGTANLKFLLWKRFKGMKK